MSFTLKLIDLGLNTNRRFATDIIDDYRGIPVNSIDNYKLSRKETSELRPKFISVAGSREFYYIIEDIKVKDVSLKNSVNKIQQLVKIEEKQTKETFDISKSKGILEQSQTQRLTNIKDQEIIFKTDIENNSIIDITNQIKKVKFATSGRDSMNIVLLEDPNDGKFILKGNISIKQSDFKKI